MIIPNMRGITLENRIRKVMSSKQSLKERKGDQRKNLGKDNQESLRILNLREETDLNCKEYIDKIHVAIVWT